MHYHREGARAPVLVAPASELKHTVRRVHFSTHMDIFRIKQNSNQVDFWIADPLPMNHLIFCTQQRNGETVVVDVLKEPAFQHWLHAIADDVKGEILRLRSAIAVRVLLEEQWEEISEQYHCYETLQQRYENTFFEQ